MCPKMEAIIARTALVRGPESATIAKSFFPSLKFAGLMGTGFAAPKIIGEWKKINIVGTMMLIKRSI